MRDRGVETPARMGAVDLCEMLGVCDPQSVLREVAKLHLVAVKKKRGIRDNINRRNQYDGNGSY